MRPPKCRLPVGSVTAPIASATSVEQLNDLIEATRLGGGPGVSVRAPRVFLAAGAVASTVILQRSGLLPARTEILDSQTLYLPFAWAGRIGRTGREPGHTLAQTFLVLEDPAVCAHPVHISLYTYNDGLSERARAAHPAIGSLLGPALDRITRHLVVGICFFHSEDSHRFASSWNEAGRSVGLHPVANPAAPAIVGRFQRALLRSLGRVGIVPLLALAESGYVEPITAERAAKNMKAISSYA